MNHQDHSCRDFFQTQGGRTCGHSEDYQGPNARENPHQGHGSEEGRIFLFPHHDVIRKIARTVFELAGRMGASKIRS